MPGYLIKDTTEDERRQIVEEALGYMESSCEGGGSRMEAMYEAYIDGKMELSEINAAFRSSFVKAFPDEPERMSCMF